MKTIKLLTILTCTALFAGAAAHAQSLLLEYNFNNNTANDSSGSNRHGTVISSGVIGADTTGVSGLAGDRAFSNLPTGGGGINYTNASGLAGLSSFTVSLWYNASTAAGIGSRLFESNVAGGALLSFTSANQLQLGINNSPAPLTTPENATLGLLNQWVYIAVTFDSTLANNELKIYAGSYNGTTLTAATLIAQADYAGTSITLTNNAATFSIGNRSGNDREFAALLDNIALYGETSGGAGALSLAQIQALQASAIPEPSSAALMLGALSLGIVALGRCRSLR